MRCIGITKTNPRQRCKNTARLLFCSKHFWQPLSGLIILGSLVGYSAGLFQDLIKPTKEQLEKRAELTRPLAVEIKRNRKTVPEWQDNPDPTKGASDIVTILLDRRPVKTIEIYHTAKDQRFKDYPPTAPLTNFRIPTSAEYQVIDLDDDGISEVIVSLTNQIYSLHYDKLINVIIFNPRGEIIATTPYSPKISGLDLDIHNPYSAFQTTGVMFDAVGNTTQATTYTNGFHIAERDGMKVLQFSWGIDNAGYADSHLHQVEEFVLKDGKLERISDKPVLYIADNWNEPWSGKQPVDIEAAKNFLKQHNQPTFAEMMKQAK